MSTTLITALLRPQAYPHPVATVERIETHISWILLTGELAYKIKKPVEFDFLDFSTREKRHFYCQEEVRLNRRLAPQLYLAVVPITGTPEAAHMGGPGKAMDYAVQMRQFDPRQTFDELLKRNQLSLKLMEETAHTLAAFHQHIAVSHPDDGFGSPAAIGHPVEENFRQLRLTLNGQAEIENVRHTIEILHQWSQQQHEQLHDVFLQRKHHGFVRECHGDLHLRNIVLWQGQVTPFDGIEFNASLRWIDVINELAFILMDLDDHAQRVLCRILLNRYLSLTGDYKGLVTLRYYQVYRAMVRAKVAGIRLAQLDDSAEVEQCRKEIHNYIQLALSYTQTDHTQLIITTGVSGSGKSFLAYRLAQHLDLIHLRSDVERKRLFGLDELASSHSPLGAGIYGADATQSTYQRLYELADSCLHSGFAVIVDATFLQYEKRQRFRTLAQQHDCPFIILDCQAHVAVLRQRVQLRVQQASDASEATQQVLERQLDKLQALTEEESHHALPIDTDAEIEIGTLIGQLNALRKSLSS